MIIKKMNIVDFKKLLGNSMTLGKGHFNRVMYSRSEDFVFKVNRKLFCNFWPSYGEETYNEKKCLLDHSHFINEDQINYFSKVQRNISLTSLPYGIIRCDGINAGVLLPNYMGYSNMGRMLINNDDLKYYLELLLEKIRELELHKIIQSDLACNFYHDQDDTGRGDLNIVIKNNDLQLIDLDGDFVRYNKIDGFEYSMYLEFIKVLKIYSELNNINYTFYDGVDFDGTMDYEKARNIFKKYKMMI